MQDALRNIVFRLGASLGLVFFLPSCGWDVAREEISSSFVAIAKADARPNLYDVHLQWEPSNDGSAWVIQRKAKEASPKVIATLEPQIRTYVDSPVLAGETYHYYLGVLNGTDYKVLQEVTLQIPRDFVVEHGTVAHSIEGYNRLFFAPNGKLVTYGGEVLISVNEILSSDGVIEIFPETAHAQFEMAGRSGGKLTIYAKTGQGTLHILARGEGGGVGPEGARGKSGYTGRTGAKGTCETRRQGNPERGPPYGNYNECLSQPEDGVPGGRGYDGNPGLPGMPGGDSARVNVRIEDPSQIQIKAEALPGKGGQGGSGGPGGYGGPGGEPGERLCTECRMPLHGFPGQPGKTGPIGPRGPSGGLQPICLSLGTAHFGDCDKFQK